MFDVRLVHQAKRTPLPDIDGGSSAQRCSICESREPGVCSRQATRVFLLLASGDGGGLLEAVGSAELLAEPLDAAGGVYKLLLAGEERMARRADINIDLRLGAAGDKFISTGTFYMTGHIPGMDLFFHGRLLQISVRPATAARQPIRV
jgi:hypothetical protein